MKWRIFKAGGWHVLCPLCDEYICCGATHDGYSNFWWATRGATLHFTNEH